MKVTVEIDKTYFQKDNFDEAIAEKIEHKVVQKIWSKIKDEVEDRIESVARERVKQEMDDKIQKEALIHAKTGKIKPNTYKYKGDKDKLTIEEYVQWMFSNQGKFDIEDILEDRAKNIAKKLKDKYDLVFAQQVIMKMKEQDLLKDDVSKALFESKLKDDSTDEN